ncbi:N-acylglucosamine 2-epimerase [Bordetella bronchialis]|uniref:N-acylglucosamine 2-epimerase n=2 Tax=Bordetella bronchialis TaxID=463025 RepID=A0ABN4R9Z8_9BORD|nr:AGE family epimerase/isomerase [Bordetella bronchialis]ANN69545.1 N-acylglucosamine 2-epimerase [Bordetella bronchialis]
MPRTGDDAALTATVARLRAHYDGVVLPAWLAQGFNPRLGLPYESLSSADARPLPPQRYRAMACARQLFVFSASRAPAAAAHAAHAALLFESLRGRFRHPAGGWVYSIGPDAAPLETYHDLYTYAFVVFACAAYYRQSRDARALDLIGETVTLIESRFGLGGGLYRAQTQDDGASERQGPLQNPIMHLTEAYLAAREAGDTAWYDAALRRIAHGMSTHFMDAATRCICELPTAETGNRIEPGHQFEWYALVRGAPGVFDGTELAASVPRAVDYAQRHGVTAGVQGVCASLDLAGGVIDGTQRIWAQTEYARCLALQGSEAAAAALSRQLACFEQRFLHERGWYECLDAGGQVARADMPSTTPYHLASCYAALPPGPEPSPAS